MSAPVLPRIPAAVTIGLMNARQRRDSEQSDQEPPLRRREPYAVERHPAPRGWVRMVGYDRHGEYLSECVIPGRKFTERAVAKFRRWCMDNDDTPVTLSVVD